ncbi:SDR family NAD(P)-dependent oxidoreductase [Neorhizobium sp. BETTINA12A]|uniref:SDR family NAD(P)-dependent oxidoreductase n=1 Tax=Neorhizobium sp. BETTINA12A TaxID=2908924 RepID=UPI001FF43840|nr:SDR family NAD(P)-dependent oxidoreductase [Neorhizobium sp. BETTINA12A]MCJ9749590.1 SDR family NAD(P)-dependent oxidoreductase [Neorhizobium sp. BETTINA12A]
MDLQLNGKVALVTGSSKGIGEAVAKGLAQEGATVIVYGRDRNATEQIKEQIISVGGDAHCVTGDLTVEEDVAAMVAEAQRLGGAIGILINNAGGSGPGEDWSNASPQSWASTYDRNVIAALRVTNAVLPGMRLAKWGRVINISSLAGLMPPPVNPDYSAAKAAMLAMTASMAKAVAGEGVTVNAISPGTIHSAKLDMKFREVAVKHGVAADAPWRDVEKVVLPLFAQVPVNRVGTLQEIADAIAFLVSPRAAYITGSNIRLDGGMLPTI